MKQQVKTLTVNTVLQMGSTSNAGFDPQFNQGNILGNTTRRNMFFTPEWGEIQVMVSESKLN